MTSTDLMNVEAFNMATPNAAFAGLNPEQESLADGIGSSYGIIGYRGKVWTLRLRGETYTFVRADDGSPAAFLDMIVLRAPGWKSKSYYAGGFVEGNSDAPSCSSLDGVHPDSDAREKQATACAICPRNEWKVDANGRKGRDCSDYKRLAVLLLPSASKALLGSPLMEPVFLRVPAASLNDLAILGEAMGKKGFHFSTYITRVGFQTDKAHPQMTFRALQPLSEKEAPIVLELREDPVAYRITAENEVGKQLPYVANGNAANNSQPTQRASSQGTSSVQSTAASGSVRTAPTTTQNATKADAAASSATTTATTAQSTQASEDDEEAALLAQLEAARKKKAALAAATTQKQEVIPPAEKTPSTVVSAVGLGDAQSVVEAGFGDLGQSNPQTVASPPTQNTVEDTGVVEESDADLDQMVAGLLKS